MLEVSRSGFHAWAAREPSARAVADAALTGRIAEIHEGSLKTYGSPRVRAELRLEDGVDVGRKRVERLMRGSPDRDYYTQTAERLGANRACLAIARKLLKRSYHTLRELGEEALQPA